MAWPPQTHQDVQDAVTVLQTSTNASLTLRAIAAGRKSSSLAVAAYTDTTTTWIENWANLTGWTSLSNGDSDTFTGTNGDALAAGWFTASGTSSIQNNTGQLAVGSTGAYAQARIDRTTLAVAGDMNVLVTATAVGAQAEQYITVSINSDGGGAGSAASNGYALWLNYAATAASGSLSIDQTIAGTDTKFTQVNGKTLTAGTAYKIRFQRVGQVLQGRVWDAAGAEPGTWDITWTLAGTPMTGKAALAIGNGAAAVAKIAQFDDWTVAGTTGAPLQVNGGRLYVGSNVAGAQGIIARTINAASTENGWAITTIRPTAADTTTGRTEIIGLSPDATTGGSNLYGLNFDGSGHVYKYTSSTQVDLGTFSTDRDYVITMTWDALSVSVIARPVGGPAGANPTEYRGRWNRFTVATAKIILSSSNALTGTSIGTFGARRNLGTFTPRAGLHDLAPHTYWTQTAAGAGVKVTVPAGYDARIPTPVLIGFHADNGNEHEHTDTATTPDTFVVDTNLAAVGAAALTAGFILVTAGTTNRSSWGNQAALDAYYAAYQLARDSFNIGTVVIHAGSMGGIESLLTIAGKRIPGIAAVALSNPTANLAQLYMASFTTEINNAYGITGTAPNTYALLTAGHDPAVMAGTAFQSLPVRIWAASDDTVVSKTSNADTIYALMQPYSGDALETTVTGGHTSTAAYPVASIISFFQQYTS